MTADDLTETVTAALRKAVTAGFRVGRVYELATFITQALAPHLAAAHEQGRAEGEAAVAAVLADSQALLTTTPLDCTTRCIDDACDCSGIGRPVAWNLDPDRVRAALSDPATALARVRADAAAEALKQAADEIHNGAGDPEQEFYDHGVSPWLSDRARRVRGES